MIRPRLPSRLPPERHAQEADLPDLGLLRWVRPLQAFSLRLVQGQWHPIFSVSPHQIHQPQALPTSNPEVGVSEN